MTKEDILANFDPSQPGLADSVLFGLPFTIDQSEFVVVPVPWEVTVSYGSGASDGPEAIIAASSQVDLLHEMYPELWKLGIHNIQSPAHWSVQSEQFKIQAQQIIKALESGVDIDNDQHLTSQREAINAACLQFNSEVKELVAHWISKGKKVVLLGGDHSTPLGYYHALADRYASFGIIHFDAHMDLRESYEGFHFSHASVMNNALKLPQLSQLVQVGIRDFCDQESYLALTDSRVKVYTDRKLKSKLFEGITWKQQCDQIISDLPKYVHVSFDIDALYQWYCPNTGTPVPGGLSYEQATYLLDQLGKSGKEIIGMDLVEVSPGKNEWDGNVGARMLFHMCGVWAANAGLPVGNPLRF
ncbi:MAG: agmatinase [Flavobacterium sp. BFFFF2]|nr:MAG: agmatinase [Flavobacterium sp. BFFFF2]